MPQLLAAMINPTDPVTSLEARRLLRDLEANAVARWSRAARLGPAAQEQVAIVLGEIGNPEAAPALAALARSQGSVPGVRNAATQALARVAPGSDARTTAELFLQLAERYYAEPRELTRFAGEEHQLVWVYEPAIGLLPTPVRTEVFHEAMTIRLVERALGKTRTCPAPSALARRELLPPDRFAEDYDNPLYGAERRREACTTPSPPAPTRRRRCSPRARAIRTRRAALLAIERLSPPGGASLWSGTPADKPLLQALSYPDRRVQFAAAMVLGNARPGEAFPGSGASCRSSRRLSATPATASPSCSPARSRPSSAWRRCSSRAGTPSSVAARR